MTLAESVTAGAAYVAAWLKTPLEARDDNGDHNEPALKTTLNPVLSLPAASATIASSTTSIATAAITEQPNVSSLPLQSSQRISPIAINSLIAFSSLGATAIAIMFIFLLLRMRKKATNGGSTGGAGQATGQLSAKAFNRYQPRIGPLDDDMSSIWGGQTASAPSEAGRWMPFIPPAALHGSDSSTVRKVCLACVQNSLLRNHESEGRPNALRQEACFNEKGNQTDGSHLNPFVDPPEGEHPKDGRFSWMDSLDIRIQQDARDSVAESMDSNPRFRTLESWVNQQATRKVHT